MRIFFLTFLFFLAINVNGQWLEKASVIDSISVTSYHPSHDTTLTDSLTYFSNLYNDFYIEQEFYKNGQIRLEMFLVKGKHDGPHRLWYPNGNLQLFLYFKNDLPVGFSSRWYESGKIEACGSYEP